MSRDDDNSRNSSSVQSQRPTQERPTRSSWLSIPAPIKRIFDRFPLITYESNLLPQNWGGSRDQHVLFIFTLEGDAIAGRPSFNPTCLKWQAYLRFQDVPFSTSPATNHASSTYSLPFLLPASNDGREPSSVSASQLERWIGENHTRTEKGHSAQVNDMRYEAYSSLLEHRIRNAYLYNLYLCSANFASIIEPLYVHTASTDSLVRLALSRQLRNTARLELSKQTGSIHSEAIYRESASAFEALAALLGDEVYFFSAKKPTLFDAAVFAYTNLLLDDKLPWRDLRMRDDLKKWQNLIRHRERILHEYFGSG